MTVSREKAALALQLLIEGTSVRATERISGLDKNAIMRLLVLAGEKCEKLMGRLLVNIPVRDVECDEIWRYVTKEGQQPSNHGCVHWGASQCNRAASAPSDDRRFRAVPLCDHEDLERPC